MSLHISVPKEQSKPKLAAEQTPQSAETEMPQISLQRRSAQIMHLQRTIGNQAAMRVLGTQHQGIKNAIQRKFTFQDDTIDDKGGAIDVAEHLYDEWNLSLEGIDKELFIVNLITLATDGKDHSDMFEGDIVEYGKKGAGKVEEKKKVVWYKEGTEAVISEKAFNSLLEVGCEEEDIIESLSNLLKGNKMGEWNSIKELDKGVYELKVDKSGKARCEGTVGDSGKIEFKNPAKKGKGK